MKILFLKCALLFTIVSFISSGTYRFLIGREFFNDRDRIQPGIVRLQIAGLRLAAQKLQQLDAQQQLDWLNDQSSNWPGALKLLPVAELPAAEQSQLQNRTGFVCRYQHGFIEYVMVPSGPGECLQLGPMLTFSHGLVEAEARGVLLLLRELATDPAATPERLQASADQCRLPMQIRTPQNLPTELASRLLTPEQPVTFFENDQCFLALSVPGKEYVICAGPLTKIRDVAMSVMYTTVTANTIMLAPFLAVILFVASRRFGRVEKAARLFSTGNLDVRADEHGAGEAAALAKTFNQMASRTADSMQAKTQLLQLVSHELRTPLARLRFALELLDSSDNPQQKHRRLSTINNSLDDLEAIVSEVLDFVRNERSTRLQSQVWLSIPEVLQAFQVSFGNDQDAPQIVWNNDAAESVDQVYADRRAFQHVLRNLIGNAWRYAHASIQVSACSARLPSPAALNGRNTARIQQQTASDQPCVCVTVEDDGPGIPVSGHSEALTPLASLTEQPGFTNSVSPPRNRSQHGGYGMGLAIVKRLVEQHGGTIAIDTSSLGGCRVRTWWPSQNSSEEIIS